MTEPTDRAAIKLRRCPFCGSANTQVRGATAFYGVCLDCGSSTNCCDSYEEAAELWNRMITDE